MQIDKRLKECDTGTHAFSRVEELTGATKYVCAKCGKEKIEYHLGMFKVESETEILIDESDYVILNPGVTSILYDNTLSISIENKDMLLLIEKDIVHVGTGEDADVLLFNKAISPKHATFYFENQAWFLQDNNSSNGTWLNDVRLIPRKKYLLKTDDIIKLAETEEIIFNKSTSQVGANRNKDVTPDAYLNKAIVDKYRVIEYLGAGGFNKTYLVEEIQTNIRWAMKICDKKQKNFNVYIRESILHEPYMMKKFNHSTIPVVKEILEDDNAIYVVREFANGQTLKQIVDETGALAEEKVIEWAKELCNMLVYLHNQEPPYIYRDMKPANVILMENGHLKVIDFGTARMYDWRKTGDTCILGTMGYAAPEQYGGYGQTDARTDIFGLGMTLHHLVTGVNPIDPPYEVRPIRECDSNLSKGLEYIIEKCIRPNPDERYQSCEALLNDLNNYMNLPKKKSLLDRLFGNR